nr:hypothetical protein [Brevundimonas diminuta]
MFGFGKRKKQQNTIALVRSVLEPIYTKHFGRSQPANLARVIVEQSFNGDAPKFLGQTVGGGVGITSHAAEALTAGYTYLDIADEARAACAEALGLLVRLALAPANEPSLTDYDHQFLTHLARTLGTDRRWQEAAGRVPGGLSLGVFTAA